MPRLEDICELDRASSDHDVLWLTITSNAALQSITRMTVEVEKGKQRYLSLLQCRLEEKIGECFFAQVSNDMVIM